MTRDADQAAMMAECMDMVRQDLIDAGVIDKSVAPMFVAEAVCSAMKVLFDEARAAEKQVHHWQANHADQVERARILIERPDLPIERVKAYEQIGKLQRDVETFVEVQGRMLHDWRRFQACRHVARTMPEDGGEAEFIKQIDKYRADNGL